MYSTWAFLFGSLMLFILFKAGLTGLLGSKFISPEGLLINLLVSDL